MKHINQFAASLYPRWWRARYGAEFSALLQDARPSLRGTFDILKGALFMQLTTVTPLRIFMVCAMCGISAAYAAYALPETVTSRAVLVVPGLETPNKQAELDQLAARTSFNLLSRAGLVNLLRDNHTMFNGQLTKEPLEAVVDRLRQSIRISTVPVGAGRAMAIEVDRSYRPMRFNSGPVVPVWFDPSSWSLFSRSERSGPGNREAQLLTRTIVGQILNQSQERERETGAKTWELLDPPSLPESTTSGTRFAAIFLGLPASILIGCVLAWWYRRKSRGGSAGPPMPALA